MKHVPMLFVFLGLALGASAQATAQTAQQTQVRDREPIYGSELMTQQERLEYQNRMRALKTEREREAFRLEHHRKMQARARAQGKTLPDVPPPGRGPGMGPGSQGVGPGERRSQTQMQTRTDVRERIYGSELMTQQERLEYQNRMRAAKTEQERAAIRQEHHKKMQARAKAQGKTLPDEPPAGRGPGMGPGGGMTGPGGRGGY